jgi:hypothetical protein
VVVETGREPVLKMEGLSMTRASPITLNAVVVERAPPDKSAPGVARFKASGWFGESGMSTRRLDCASQIGV